MSTIRALASMAILAASAWTQSLPTGVIGAVPAAQRSIVKYVRYYGLTVPVNGLGNYVFYYTPEFPQTPVLKSKFLETGNGAVEYLDADRNFVSVANWSVDYNPAYGYTTTTPVPGNPFNSGGAGAPPGMFGIVTSDGTPRFNVTVRLYRLEGGGWLQVDQVKTNANGFYNFYYTATANKEFLYGGTYRISPLCGGAFVDVQYQPNSPAYTDPGINVPFSIPSQCSF